MTDYASRLGDPREAQKKSTEKQREKGFAVDTTPAQPRLDDGEIELSQRQRQIMRMLATGATVKQCADALGLHPNTIRNAIKGRNVPHVREAFKQLLEMEGLTLDTMAKQARELVEAVEWKWNPAAEMWDEFPDNKVRLGAWRHLTVLHEMVSSGSTANVAGVSVTINTNIDEPSRKGGDFEIEINPREGSQPTDT